MKPLSYVVLAFSLALAGNAYAAPGNALSVTPPGQEKRPVDPDKGDDNASPVAVLKVSNKATPAALRSAIVPRVPDSL